MKDAAPITASGPTESTTPTRAPANPNTAFQARPSFAVRPTASTEPDSGAKNPHLRLWPALVILAVQWLVVLTVKSGSFELEQMTRAYVFFIGPDVGAFLLCCWWLFASRLPRKTDKLLVIYLMFAGLFSLIIVGDWPERFALAGLIAVGMTITPLIWIVWLFVSFGLPWRWRRGILLALLVLGWTYTALLRLEGLAGDMNTTTAWRWSPKPEEAAPAATAHVADVPFVVNLQPGDWPGFRGPHRDGTLPGVRIATDWDKNPPRVVWRRAVGPGWSSFAVVDHRLYTQEQRGEFEMVVCYAGDLSDLYQGANSVGLVGSPTGIGPLLAASTFVAGRPDAGEEIWAYKSQGMFTEAMAGPGPRATPTFHDGKIYALGARGTLTCLDAGSGKLIWTKDVKDDSKGTVPDWGFAGSPLVNQGLVIVFASGPVSEKNTGYVVAYDIATGALKWMKETGRLSYCSPQRVEIFGEEQILITSDFGITSFHPTLGHVLWQHEWSTTSQNVVRCTQPTQIGDSDFLLGTGMERGMQRVHVSKEGDAWKTTTKWMTRKMAPYFNDLVVHKGHIYGFDGSFLTCLNVDDARPQWRTRGYANGQLLLLPDQDLLLIVTEAGKLALVEAKPKECKELASMQPFLNRDRTWNHPVIAHGKLYIRNGTEAICYQLTEISAKNESK